MKDSPALTFSILREYPVAKHLVMGGSLPVLSAHPSAGQLSFMWNQAIRVFLCCPLPWFPSSSAPCPSVTAKPGAWHLAPALEMFPSLFWVFFFQRPLPGSEHQAALKARDHPPVIPCLTGITALCQALCTNLPLSQVTEGKLQACRSAPRGSLVCPQVSLSSLLPQCLPNLPLIPFNS